jgi:hypothetical protein
MITRTKQDWTQGATAKVGFLTLEVVECVPTPGDYRPDDYRLWNPQTGAKYTFTPHNGLAKGWHDADGREF